MRTFGEALDKATTRFIKTGKVQYIIYNHLKCVYRVSVSTKHDVNEELANLVSSHINTLQL